MVAVCTAYAISAVSAKDCPATTCVTRNPHPERRFAFRWGLALVFLTAGWRVAGVDFGLCVIAKAQRDVKGYCVTDGSTDADRDPLNSGAYGKLTLLSPTD